MDLLVGIAVDFPLQTIHNISIPCAVTLKRQNERFQEETEAVADLLFCKFRFY